LVFAEEYIMRAIRNTVLSILPSGSWSAGARIAALGLIAIGFLWHVSGRTGETATPLPPPAIDNQKAVGGGLETAVLAAGCFWGVQGVYQHTKGVKQVVSGYSGGDKERAHYEQVGTGQTGHAESVQITFDPHEISYGEILRIYFSVAHDPTQLNRQGPDYGSQYRSAIFYADASHSGSHRPTSRSSSGRTCSRDRSSRASIRSKPSIPPKPITRIF
jgi:peptide-methionine (S)-S-oxide reductase